MKLNKFLQRIFKKFFQNLFRALNGKIILYDKKDNLEIHSHEINSLEIEKKTFNI